MTHDSSLSRTGLFHLCIVYVVWGSTYLAIRVTVREGSGFPPFTMVAMRLLVASALLFGWAFLTREHLRVTKSELFALAGSGILLWTAANGLVTWAEQRTDSGLTALMVGAMPMWAASIESLLDRRAPSLLLVVSLLAGFAGVGVLSTPVLLEGTSADAWAIIALLIAPISWAGGSLLFQRRRPKISPRAAAAYQQLAAGLGLVLLALITREPRPNPIHEAWLAWGYLVTFGSIVAFTSFVYVLHLLPVNVGMTYAYVNPVIAVFLGWLILGEPITGWTLVGAALVIAGVWGVFHERIVRMRQQRNALAFESERPQQEAH